MEAGKNCPSCGRHVGAASGTCPHCGSDLALPRGQRAAAGGRASGAPRAVAPNPARSVAPAPAPAAERAPAPARPAADTLEGTRIDEDLRVLRLIARGGMGEVYLARQDSLARDVAIKVMKRSLAENEANAERFLQEGRAASQIKHPLAVAVHGVGRLPNDGRPYIVMEYVPGRPLAALLLDRGHLRVHDALTIARGTADLLAVAHDKGIVHRDIKPDNILIVADERQGLLPRVLDFGIARVLTERSERLTEAGMTYGTPDYMSPEQALGEELDGRSDIYSLALVLYEMLAGAPPFRDASKQVVIQRQITETPKPLDRAARMPVPPELVELVGRCLEKEVADRPSSMRDVVAVLDRLLAATPAASRESGPFGVDSTTSGSHRVRNRRHSGARRAVDSDQWMLGARAPDASGEPEAFSMGDDVRPVAGLSGSHQVVQSAARLDFAFDDDGSLDEPPPQDRFLRRTRSSRIGAIVLFITVVALFVATVVAAVLVVLDPDLVQRGFGTTSASPTSGTSPPTATATEDEEVVVTGIAPSVEAFDEPEATPPPTPPTEPRGRVARNRDQAAPDSVQPADSDAPTQPTSADPVDPPAPPTVVLEAPPDPPSVPVEAPAVAAVVPSELDVPSTPPPVAQPPETPPPAAPAVADELATMRARVAAHLERGECVRADEIVVEMRSRFGQAEATRHYGALDACRNARRSTARPPERTNSQPASTTPARTGGTAGGGGSTTPRRVTPPTEL